MSKINKSRFYFPEKFFRPQNKGTILAFFTFVDNETGLEYSSFRLVNGQKGVFVSSPSEKYQDNYYNHVRPAYDHKAEDNRNAVGKEYMQALTDAAYEFYQKKQDGVAAGATTGRGPVDDETPDDLPF